MDEISKFKKLVTDIKARCICNLIYCKNINKVKRSGYMDLLSDVIKFIVPTIIGGLITFLVTKYSYNRNISTDKLAIAYNRVYYPIYRLITDETNKDLIVEKSNNYIKKYKKYVDKSTIIALRNLMENVDNKQEYKIFTNNIYEMDSKLRKRLGYLEPNILSIYKYIAPVEKRVLKMFIEFIGCYLSITIVSFLDESNLKEILIWIAVLFFMASIGNLMLILFQKIIRKICNLKK